ncbi:MAG: hypothetical protein ACOC3I_11735 [Verrucomicrobiota bacterium]
MRLRPAPAGFAARLPPGAHRINQAHQLPLAGVVEGAAVLPAADGLRILRVGQAALLAVPAQQPERPPPPLANEPGRNETVRIRREGEAREMKGKKAARLVKEEGWQLVSR